MEVCNLDNFENLDNNVQKMINDLVKDNSIVFKNQHKDEKELDDSEKRNIAVNIFLKRKSLFLSRFGRYLIPEFLNYFNDFISDDTDGYAIQFYLKELKRYHSSTRNKDIRNRRYEAMKKLFDDGSYFSETEMMNRNPLLYENLIGQYLTEEEKKERDRYDNNTSFVDILMSGLDRQRNREYKQQQIEDEDEVMMEDEDDSSDEEYNDKYNNEPSCSMGVRKRVQWGEMDSKEDRRAEALKNNKDTVKRDSKWFLVSDSEKQLLRDEFISYMVESFLDGNDEDFDYSTVDLNTEYDCIEVRTQDEEEKYFDSESPNENMPQTPEENKMTVSGESSEDELEIYMKHLRSNPTVSELVEDMKKM